VFEDIGAYVILLVFQKRQEDRFQAPPAMIVKCQDLVGRALQDAVEGVRTENDAYSIYDVDQSVFQEADWIILPPVESTLARKLETFPRLGEFLEVKQGFVSGADSVFIVEESQVPEGEESLFVPLLADKEMRAYSVPPHTSRYFFYPFVEGHLINEPELREMFPKTWHYLLSVKDKLSARAAVQKGMDWWRPERPRLPKDMMRPKIVSLHLVIVPRFSVDLEGKYAISRSPILLPIKDELENEFLRYFSAVLNSAVCYWYISSHSHIYNSGYAMLEPKTLKQTPVPHPSRIAPGVLRRVLNLVDARLVATGQTAVQLEKQIESLVAELYGLTQQEKHILGID
jgi:hypothetical protein